MSSNEANKIFLRDAIKKHHGFLRGRRRKLSYTDAVLGQVFDKLRALVNAQVLERFRVVFGSDIVELRFTQNPLLPAIYRTDSFLAIDFAAEPVPSIDPARRIPLERVPEILERMKDLRGKDRKFLEAFRINTCADNIWAYFSSAKSLFADHSSFLAYLELRDEQERVNAELETLLTFHGDEFEALSEVMIRDVESEADRRIDAINQKTARLFLERRIFEFQLYNGSGLVRVISTQSPHTPLYFTVDQYLADGRLDSSPPLRANQSDPAALPTRPNRLSREILARLLDLAKLLRSSDDELYMRVLYVDAVTDTVVTSFSCGGTYCQSAEEFLDSGFASVST